MNVLGLKVLGHDTGAAIISGGKVVAISEERLNRIKYSNNIFPELSIKYCLNALALNERNIDLVIVDRFVPSSKIGAISKEIFEEKVGHKFKNAKIETCNHHDAHAASAFFCSPFKEAAVLIYDGAGELKQTQFGTDAIETETMYRGENNKLYEIQKTLHVKIDREFPISTGIGKMYSIISNKYLNFGSNNEGKLMGLAGYGDDSFLKKNPPEKWFKELDNHLICNPNFKYPSRSISERAKEKKSLKLFLTTLRVYIKINLRNAVKKTGSKKWGQIFEAIEMDKKPRNLNEKLPEPYYASVAYAAQKFP